VAGCSNSVIATSTTVTSEPSSVPRSTVAEIASTTTAVAKDQEHPNGPPGVLAYVVDTTEVAKVWSMELNGDDLRVLADLAVDWFLNVVPSPAEELLAVVDQESHAVVSTAPVESFFVRSAKWRDGSSGRTKVVAHNAMSPIWSAGGQGLPR